MKAFIKQGFVLALICAGGVALSGCYESDTSIIAAADSIMPLKVGKYCQYDFSDDQRTWEDTCNEVTISSPSSNTYVLDNRDIDTTYTVHIHGKPIAGGDLEGNYIVEACWAANGDTDPGCYVGTIRVFDNQTFHWVYPACTSPDDDSAAADPCHIDSVATARAQFANATTWGTDDLRKYVWKSN